MRKLYDWFTRWFTGKPHFYIGGETRPYLLRWFVLPRNPWLNIYLHKFLRDDDDRALHDHPWWFVSLMLWGCYRETRQRTLIGKGWESPYVESRVRGFGSIVYRPATTRHKVALKKDETGSPIPCWTLVITGPKHRTWGFWCPKGFVPWHEFVDQTDHGNTGKGCGD
jgi:hypothetical protein